MNSDLLLQQLLTETPSPPDKPCRLVDILHGHRLVIYGCGEGFVAFSIIILNKFGIRPEVILDKKFSEPAVMDGIPAMSPLHFTPSSSLCENAVVVITVARLTLHPEIIDYLKGMGFKHIISYTDIYEYHLSLAPCGFERLGHVYFQKNADVIEEAYNLLADSYSKEVFTQVLRAHVTRTPVPTRSEPVKEMYFPHDIPLKKGVSRTIDCGAYNGDTAQNLYDHFGKIDSLICFEPDPANFAQLSAYLANNDVANSIISFPCAVWHNEEQLPFRSGQTIGSVIREDGNMHIQGVALDHVIPAFPTTFIIMDVESAELNALKGAVNLIKNNKPDLAICVYHHPRQLWEIVRYLKSLNLGYHFYLRNYSGFPIDTILYAT